MTRKQREYANKKLYAFCLRLQQYYESEQGGETEAPAGIPAAEGKFDIEPVGRRADRPGQGVALSQFLRETGCFPVSVCGLLETAERTGHMKETLAALTEYYAVRAQTDRRMRTALLYPALLVLVMLVVLLVLLSVLLPVFRRVYGQLGGQLASLAMKLLRLGETMDRVLPLLYVLLTALLTLLILFGASASFRRALLTFWQSKRGDRGVWGAMNLAQFAQSLALGLGSGLDIPDTLTLVGHLLDDVPSLAERCRICLHLQQKGTSVARAIKETQLLPYAEARLLALGFRDGTPAAAAEQVAHHMTRSAEAALERFSSRLEPVLAMACALLVALILLSVLVPVLTLVSAIG